MNKKLTSVLLTAAVLAQIGLPAMSAAAEGEAEAATIPVHITIGNAGTLAVPCETVQVSDLDGDGIYTIDEAFFAVHEAYYEGGAAAGYASETTDWGLSLKTLWGVTNGGSYGYYVNNASAYSLSDPLNADDYLNAFSYQDLTGWSDTYCFFDVNAVTDAKQGDAVTLKLSAAAYDENWMPVTEPVRDAVITIDGARTAYTTDENGEVTVTLEKAGDLILSAVSDTAVLVPTALRAHVAEADVITTAPEAETTAAATTTTAKGSSNGTSSGGSKTESAAKTGETAAIPALALTAVLACGTAFALRRRND